MPVTGAPDYADDAFDGDGYYLVTYGGDPVPKGPYATVPEMAQANDLRDYPDDGYVVEVAQGWIGTVPSLNPDDLLPSSVRHLTVMSDADTRESCGSCNADIGPSRSFPWHFPSEDCRSIRDPITPTSLDDVRLYYKGEDRRHDIKLNQYAIESEIIAVASVVIDGEQFDVVGLDRIVDEDTGAVSFNIGIWFDDPDDYEGDWRTIYTITADDVARRLAARKALSDDNQPFQGPADDSFWIKEMG